MSIKRTLACFSLSAALLASVAGCQGEAATAQSFDTSREDVITAQPISMRDTDPPREPKDLPPDDDEDFDWEPQPWEAIVDPVSEITPEYGDAIRRMAQQNRDVVGWLHVPGTNIDEVVLQNPADSNTYKLKNDYYLNRDFQKQADRDGLFCVDYRATFGPNGREDLSRVTTVYGHSWDDNPDGDLFSQLKRYRDPTFAGENPYVFFSTEAEDMAWEVFAVFDTTIYLPYVRPRLPLDKFYSTLEMVYDLSYYNYDVAVDDRDRILVLSTCTYSVEGHETLPAPNDYRFVVMARLMDPDETRRDSAVFAVNDSPLEPDATFEMAALDLYD